VTEQQASHVCRYATEHHGVRTYVMANRARVSFCDRWPTIPVRAAR